MSKTTLVGGIALAAVPAGFTIAAGFAVNFPLGVAFTVNAILAIAALVFLHTDSEAAAVTGFGLKTATRIAGWVLPVWGLVAATAAGKLVSFAILYGLAVVTGLAVQVLARAQAAKRAQVIAPTTWDNSKALGETTFIRTYARLPQE